MVNIELNHIQKKYSGGNLVIPDLTCEIKAGERLVLLGPSGCGKSTLLRMIAGLENTSGGTILMNGKDITKLPSGERNVSMVFQNYALYPHMTVEENITYALKVNKVPKPEIQKRLKDVLESLGLEEYKNRKPNELSGGQRQRVALARATVKRSGVFLLDEPLSNLDVQLRTSARRSMLDIHEKYGQTMIYVTHDQIEAMTFGTKIILLNKGIIQMYDTPYNVYHYPANVFTAKFIGCPAMNILSDIVLRDNKLNKNKQTVVISEHWKKYLNGRGEHFFLGIRPENVRLHKNHFNSSCLCGIVSHVENQGPNYAVYVNVEGEMMVGITEDNNYNSGSEVYIELLQEHLHFFDEASTENVGRPIAFRTVRQNFFDSEGFKISDKAL